MKRDLNLIRDLLLDLETGEWGKDAQPDPDLQVRYGVDTVEGHLRLLEQAGFIELGLQERGKLPWVSSITWAGHDYLDSVRHPGVWKQVLEKLKSYGQPVALSVVQQLAQQVVATYLGLPN